MTKRTVPPELRRPKEPKEPPPPLTFALIKVCPECAGPILRGSACMACAHCGWGRCV